MAAYLPLVAAICAIILTRWLMGTFAPGLHALVEFVVALGVGYAAYLAVERRLDQRDRGGRQ